MSRLVLLLLLLPVAATAQNRASVISEIDSLEVELLRLDDDISSAAVRDRDAEARLQLIESQLGAAERRLAERRQRMDLRLRAMYRFRHRGFLPLLFSARSPHELLRSARYLWWIVRSDQQAVEGWTAELEHVAELRQQVEAERRALLQWAGEAAVERQAALLRRDERQASLGQVRDPLDRRRIRTVIVPDAPDRVDLQLDLRAEALPDELAVEELQPRSLFERSKGRLPLPAVGPVSRAGAGLDIAIAAGATIRAVFGGKVQKVVPIDGLGVVLILDHGDGWHTIYGHAASFSVRLGDTVASGDPVGVVGPSQGDAKIHFEVRRQRAPEDPFDWVAIPLGVRVTGR